MSGLGFSIKFWSLTQCNISDNQVNINCYHDKSKKSTHDFAALELPELSKQYYEKRNEIWMPRNKRPEKMRENIKLLEENFRLSAVICTQWRSSTSLHIIFSSGLSCDIDITCSYDINKIAFDKSLAGKVENPMHAVSSGDMTFFCYQSFSKIEYVVKKPEMKLASLLIPGPKGKVRRCLVLNEACQLVACWWKLGNWTQTANEIDRVNLVLMNCTASELTITSAILTEYDISNIRFSQMNPTCILSVEKTYELGTQFVYLIKYECSSGSLHRLNVAKFPLKGGILTSSWDTTEEKVIVCCSDGSISVYDIPINQCTFSITSTFIPTMSLWMESVIIIGSANGEISLYDSILNPLSLYDFEENQLEYLDLSPYVSGDGSLASILPNEYNELFALYTGGPVGVVKLHGCFSFSKLVQMYLNNNMASEAVALLQNVNWNVNGKATCKSMLTIVDYLLSQPLNHKNEKLLENALSCFYSPIHALAEVEVLKYRTTVGNYLRRFFHHLLRYCRLEQAFLVAKDLNASELFYDIHFLAKELSDMRIAALAKSTGDQVTGSEKHMERLNLQQQEINESNHATTFKGSNSLKVTNLGYV